MRLKITRTNSNTNYYIIKDFKINGKRTTKIIEKLGTENDIKLKFKTDDINQFLNEYVLKLNKEENKSKSTLIKFYDENKLLNLNLDNSFNIGYLFLQDIYYSLKIDKICDTIKDKYQFHYDLNNILSNLIYSRIIYPSSKLKTLDLSKNFIEQPNFTYNDLLRSLEVISKENDFIQAELYQNSLKRSKRNDKILFYDCTNYYFEIEEADEFRKYGKSKEHRPNPIVGMGLFIDGDGIPLAFDTFPGDQNEQPTLKPLENKIINDFGNSRFVVCTDAGLASKANRKFNNINGRKFITIQSIKKLKEFLKKYALDLTSGWKLPGINKTFNISALRSNDELLAKYYNKVFYKERWIKEDGIEQRLIITFSPKYQEYQRNIREKQIQRAQSIINKKPREIKSNNDKDPKRFIKNIPTTINGEVAANNNYELDYKKIDKEAIYDGLYAICTNLEDDVMDIIKINKSRWEIEESFRIMKTEFKARPVYLSRGGRIKAHFTTCFLALVIYRYLEKVLNEQYTVSQIVETLRTMSCIKKDDDFIPTYKRTKLTDSLHEKFSFRTDYEILSEKNIKKIIKQTKN
jgi:transposase